jgi:OOP family OmpA-OmpF porin
MGNYNKYLILIFLVSISHFSTAQNLVPNGSFEPRTGCPNDFNQLNYLNNWVQPTRASTDYFHSCAPNYGYCNILNNYFGNQLAQDGMAYIGLYTFTPLERVSANYREYIQVRLKSSLKKGHFYDFKMYFSLADSCKIYSPNIGVLFTEDRVEDYTAGFDSSGYSNLPFIPQIENTTELIGSVALMIF